MSGGALRNLGGPLFCLCLLPYASASGLWLSCKRAMLSGALADSFTGLNKTKGFVHASWNAALPELLGDALMRL